MSKKQKHVIYVAESSRVLANIICTELEEAGYKTEVFKDGFSLLKKIVTDSPAMIIADKNLAVINGLELCSILKFGSPKNKIPFILLSSDYNIFDFWNRSVKADKSIIVTAKNISSLPASVKEFFAYEDVELDSFIADEESSAEGAPAAEEPPDQQLATWLVTAMNKGNYFLNMTNNICQLYSNVKDLDTLVKEIFNLFYSACEYDVVTLILDSDPAKVYSTGTELFDSTTVEDFWNICRTEFEQKSKKKYNVIYEKTDVPDIIGDFLVDEPEELDEKKLESYCAFTLQTQKELVGTIHFASSRKQVFNHKVQTSINYVLPALSEILQESLQRSNLALQESKIRTAFSKFVPEQIINDFINSDKDNELMNNNEKRNVVILMSDIRNFTSISEINKPEDVVNFLNNYFTHMVDVVKKYGGTVDKFIGDAIMVLFGAPISYNDNAKRAVQAALEMNSQLANINCSQLKFPEGMKFEIGIGIHYGDVIVGQIGSADKTNYTAIGDTVNVASRLEGLTKLYGTKLIISEAVRDELDDSMNILLLDSVRVKGKKESVLIYRVDEKPLPKEYTQAYEKGFKSYNEGVFNLAIPYFEKALECLPQDKAAKLMLDRCNEFIINKPENWDGAIALTSK